MYQIILHGGFEIDNDPTEFLSELESVITKHNVVRFGNYEVGQLDPRIDYQVAEVTDPITNDS